MRKKIVIMIVGLVGFWVSARLLRPIFFRQSVRFLARQVEDGKVEYAPLLQQLAEDGKISHEQLGLTSEQLAMAVLQNRVRTVVRRVV